MNVRKLIAGATVATAVSLGTLAPASAAPRQQAGAIGGLLAAVVQVQDIQVEVIRIGDVDVNVALQNVLNNNRILTDFLNRNNINVEDVVDIRLVRNVVVVVLDVL